MSDARRLRLRRSALAVLLGMLGATGAGAAQPTAAGVVITNTATAGYADRLGHLYVAQSNTIVETVAPVAALVVSPDIGAARPASDTVTAGRPVTRTFTLTNAGNSADAYTIAAVDVGPGRLLSVTFSGATGPQPVTLGSTLTPPVAPGASIAVNVTVATVAIALGTTFAIRLTARTTAAETANGQQSASGTQWVIVQSAPMLAGADGAGSRIGIAVNGSQMASVAPGASVTYTFVFKNYGGSAADNVVLTDALPAGLTPDLASITVNGRAAGTAATLQTGTLTLMLGSIPPGATVSVTIDAAVSSGLPLGSSYVNVAQIGAGDAAPSLTLPASIFLGTSNILFDGDAGSAAPIEGAIVTLLDPLTAAPVPVGATALARGRAGATPPPLPASGATAGSNPFVTSTGGLYAFALAPRQLGAVGAPATYLLTVSAAGFLHRRIAVSFEPDGTGLLDTVTMTAADAQPLAAAGGFTIVQKPVALAEVTGLLANVPLFKTAPLSIADSVDRNVAAAGDRLVYSVTFGTGGGETLGAATVAATLPPGVAYARTTARLDGVAIEPLRHANVLTWSLSALAGQHTLRYAAVVLPGVEETTILTSVATVEALSQDGRRLAASATAATSVIGGVLSDRGAITGRAFVDAAGTGHFAPGDRGVADVRIFLENGESVTTDRFGRFSFAAVRPGQHVLRLDTTTLPARVRAAPDRRYDSSYSVVRLVHGVLDAGLMQDINFALDTVP